MKIIVGLGNPGEKYKNSRHNVGFMVVDHLNAKNKKLKTFKSDYFMNDSGKFVLGLVKKYKLGFKNLVVVHDDLDIKLGDYKIQFAKGPRDHKGLKSIDQNLGSDKYWRVRIGIDNRDNGRRIKGEQYVLEDFKKEEMPVLMRVFEEICKKLPK